MKYIDAETLKAELERRIKESNIRQANLEAIHQEGAGVVESPIRAILKSLLSFINSLQQEQPEVDLEKEINRAWEHFEKDYSPSALDKSVIIVSGLIGQKQFSRIAKYFFELGFNAIKKENK